MTQGAFRVVPSRHRFNPVFVAQRLASLNRHPDRVQFLFRETLVDATRPASQPAWTTAMVTTGWDRGQVFANSATASPSANPPPVSRGQPEVRFVSSNDTRQRGARRPESENSCNAAGRQSGLLTPGMSPNHSKRIKKGHLCTPMEVSLPTSLWRITDGHSYEKASCQVYRVNLNRFIQFSTTFCIHHLKSMMDLIRIREKIARQQADRKRISDVFFRSIQKIPIDPAIGVGLLSADR